MHPQHVGGVQGDASLSRVQHRDRGPEPELGVEDGGGRLDADLDHRAIAQEEGAPEETIPDERSPEADTPSIDDAEASGDTAGEEGQIHEVIIDDSGIIIRQDEGDVELEIGKLDGHQKRLPATVVTLSFYDPKKERVRL